MTCDIYLITDQPETCRRCGARTDFEQLSVHIQRHQCLDCGYDYFLEDDPDEQCA